MYNFVCVCIFIYRMLIRSSMIFILYLQAPFYRQRHPQEDDPVSGRPLFKDTEDQNTSHGWKRSWVASQRNDQSNARMPTAQLRSHLPCPRMLFVSTEAKRVCIRPVVDKPQAQLHKHIT